MKKFFTLSFLLAAFLTANAQQPYFTTYPTLSPDGQTVIFAYEGDLWKAGVENGTATRLTAMQGEEINPRISPDGKMLAFSSNQYGNYDVYVMPLEGGDIRQLTWNDAGDEVDGWSWDNKTIYFTSGRYNSFSGYKVAANGGTATRLFPGYFNTTHNIFEAPNGEIFFNDTWESKNFASRKQYKGEYNPDIQSYNPQTKAYKQYTDYRGKDFWATVDRKGTIYFVSDEANNEYNLYTFTGGKKTQLTSFNTSIKRPFVAANGNKVVFEKDYQLFVYDVASKKSSKIELNLLRNNVLVKEQEFNIRNSISNFDVSPDGKKIAFISRGEIFVSDINGKFMSKINRSGERAMEVKWLADNRTLLFNQTFEGYQNLFTINADGTGNQKQHTKDKRNNRDIALNRKRTMGIYLSGRDEVRTIDLKTFESKATVKDEIWAFQNSSPSFSPDGEYALFTAIRNFEQDVFVHHLKTNKTINLTNTGVTESGPIWSPDGKYIFITSSRTKPSYPFGLQDPRLYRMALDYYDEPYQSDKFNELFKQEEKPDTSKNKKPATPPAPSPSPSAIVINTEDIMKRLENIGPAFGSQFGVDAFQKDAKTYVFFVSNHQGTMATYRTTIEPFEANKTDKVTDGGINGILEVSGKYFVLSNGVINKYNPDQNQLTRMEMDYKFVRNLSAEFNQMYDETWAGVEENFYDENFHGIDWTKMKERYAAYLPYVTNRSDLRMMLNDMLGELNSSHMGFNSFGAEERKSLTYTTNETGIIFDDKDPYLVRSVVAGSNARRKDINVQAGDRLVAVNGVSVNKDTDRDYYFSSPTLMREMTLEFGNGNTTKKVKIHPQSGGALRNNLYDEWITANRNRVNQLSNNRIAYTYMKNMGTQQLESFLLDMVSEEQNKDAIILDLRYNTGGNVHDEVLKFLSQRPYLQWKYRGGKITPQSNFGPAVKPIVLLVNEQSLSDAEMTATGFKELKLGKIIGTETYRWIIFTSAKGLVDGSSYRLPSWGTYTLGGKNIEKEGVTPDIYVKNTFTDRLENKDPQIERAVSEIMKQLK